MLALASLLAGCSSTGIRASRLPDDLRAAKRESSKLIDLAQVASPGVKDSTIGPRDLLDITVATGREGEKPTATRVRVAENGTVDVPLVGVIQVSGMETHQAGVAIAQAAMQREIFKRPYVTVEMEAKATRSITVLGAVNSPGVHELPYGNSNLVSALAAAGGLSEEAGTQVEIIRQPTFAANPNSKIANARNGNQGGVGLAAYHANNPTAQNGQLQVMKLDLTQNQFKSTADTRLGDRDIVKVVPRKEEMVFVSGLVIKPGQYELPLDQDMHLLDAIARAGGKSSPVADKVSIIRHPDHRPEPIVIQASLSTAKGNGNENIRLAKGDTIIVDQTPATVVVDTFRQIFRVTVGMASNTAL